VEENLKIAQQFQRVTTTCDKEAADYLSNSEYTTYKTVAQAIQRYLPILYHAEMTTEEIVASRFALKDGPSDAV